MVSLRSCCFTHFPGNNCPSPQNNVGRGRTIKGEVSSYAVGAEMATIEACQSSLEQGWDWIRDKTLEDVRNRLVRGWTHQKPAKTQNVDWLF